MKFLEMNFGRERKLESGRKVYLATELGLDPKQVAVWFQNRRARWKNKQLEEEYVQLRSMHEAIVTEKCHLEAEVRSLLQAFPKSAFLTINFLLLRPGSEAQRAARASEEGDD